VFLKTLHATLDTLAREVLVTAVDRFELAAVNRHDHLLKQLQLPADADKLRTHPADRLAVVAPELANRLVVRHQPTRQPDQIHIPMCLLLQYPRRSEPVQVTVHIDLQHHRRFIARSAGLTRLCTIKAKLLQIKPIHERIDHPHRVIVCNVIFEALGE